MKNPIASHGIFLSSITAVKLETQLLFVPEIVRNPNIKRLCHGGLRDVIQPKLRLCPHVHIIGHIRRFAVIPQCSLSVKLEIADVVICITEISVSLYRYPYFYGLTI